MPLDPPSTKETVVRLDGVTKRFEGVVAVRDVTMSVGRGTIHGLLGPNAAGKTTAIKMMVGKLKPDSGSVSIFDQAMPKGFTKIAGRIGVMPQGQALYGDLTALQNLKFFAAMQDLRGGELNTRVHQAVGLMRLEKEVSKPVYALSGGTRQRLSLACALLHSPELLFLDEPTVGIDPVLRQVFWDHFEEMRKAGTTIVLTTHYIHEAENCDFVSLMREGRLIVEGSPSELKDRHGARTLEEVFVKVSQGGIVG